MDLNSEGIQKLKDNESDDVPVSRKSPDKRGHSVGSIPFPKSKSMRPVKKDSDFASLPHLKQRISRLTVQDKEVFFKERYRTVIDPRIKELYLLMHDIIETKTRDVLYCPNYFKPGRERSWRTTLYRTLHDEDFNIYATLIYAVIVIFTVLSLLATVLESMPSFAAWKPFWTICEKHVTIMFTIEYVARVALVKNRKSYVLETMNIFDCLAIVPFYLSLMLGAQFPANQVLKALRLARITRIRVFQSPIMFILYAAISNSRTMLRTLFIFITILVLIGGTLLFELETLGSRNTFNSIPDAMHFTFISMSTVGYGNVVVADPFSKILTVFIILAGCLINAVSIMSIGQNFIDAHDIYQKEIDEVIRFFIDEKMLSDKYDKFEESITPNDLLNYMKKSDVLLEVR